VHFLALLVEISREAIHFTEEIDMWDFLLELFGLPKGGWEA
jgi:hypothetical protein